MFASMKTKIVTIDGDDGVPVVVTIQKMSWKRLREAAEATSAAAIKSAQAAGADLLKALRDVASEQEAERQKKSDAKKSDAEKAKDEREALYRQYDRELVLRHGVLKWSATRDVATGIMDLDEPVADRLHREVIDLSIPQGDPKAVQGEGSAASTAT